MNQRPILVPVSILTAVVAWLLVLDVALAGDWSQFRRDAARTGDAPDEVLEFPMKRVLAVKFPAPIYASAAVVAGRVYVQDVRGRSCHFCARGNAA